MEGTMLAKPRVYLDTSVLSACVDERTLHRLGETREFWDRLGDFDACTCTITEREVLRVRTENQRLELLALLSCLTVHPLTQQARDLAARYIEAGVFTRKMRVDARYTWQWPRCCARTPYCRGISSTSSTGGGALVWSW
jgi:predicted nucleic acid-binding protein